MSDETVLQKEIDDGVCTITLDRPDAMNALNGALVGQLWHEFYELRHDDRVRVVILTGAGEKAFCAGADLEERRSMSEAEVTKRIDDYRGCFGAVADLPKPTIAAINGYAFGGGLELALACDLRIVARQTKVGLTETRLGIIPGAGGTQRLPRLIGASKAKELIFTGARLSGEEAEAYGIANDVVDADEVMKRAHELASEMLKAAPIALAQAKIAIDGGMQCDLQTGLELESRAYAVTIPTEDR
ncbi:MAG: enoyl-CoA hydratase-related protein, partial [Persicimonas sp.]